MDAEEIKPKRVKISLATKFALTFVSLFVLAMLLVMYAVGQIVVTQFTKDYESEVEAALNSVRLELKSRQQRVLESLQQFGKKLKEDNSFRLHAFILEDRYNPTIVDYAGADMSAMGLQVLEIANGEGVVLSSGHARNSFGRQSGPTIRALQSMDGNGGLVWFESDGREFLCLAGLASVRIGSELVHLVGGVAITPSFLLSLQNDSENLVLVQMPKSVISSSPGKMQEILSDLSSTGGASPSVEEFEKRYSVGEFSLPVLEDDQITDVTVYLLHPRTELLELIKNLSNRIIMIAAFGSFLAIALAVWLTRSVAKPLQRLANTANNLSMEKLHGKFDVDGNDEVGVLNEALRSMLKRLRLSRMKLASAERKAAYAELAQQVNHDIKNGFLPIRKVMEHWQEVAEKEPDRLVPIFNERKATVIESIGYLEELARSYSRLNTSVNPTRLNLNGVVRNIFQGYEELGNERIDFRMSLDASEPWVHADETQLRRAIENIMQNAIDAIEGSGEITVSTRGQEERVILTFQDNGRGITPEVGERLFKPYVTTKVHGTGIGLANVNRIIQDCSGTVTIQSEQGRGTSVVISLPVLTT